MLEGREEELAWLATRLAALREHRPFAALVRGEAGVGKSALIDAAVQDAKGVRVLRARGYESDREIPFAGLLELAAPLLELRERLPGAQRDAVEAAFALRRPEPHDRFAVPAGLLGLLSHAAEDEPLVTVVDDVHWLDDASRDALLFVARRLAGEPIGVLMGLRDGAVADLDFSGIEELALAGLDEASSLRLLRRDSPDLPERVAGALVAATAGNPLALQEVPAALSAGQRAGTDALADPLPTTAAVEEAFARQIAALPAEAGAALTVAAAMSRIDLDELLPALERVGLDQGALGPAEQAGLLTPAGPGRVGFRHPLLRAAAFNAATGQQQRDAHTALAHTARDPRRRAWHLAHAAVQADEEVATALEDAAHDARGRGGHAEAARAFTRAAELSTVPAARGRRSLEAAQDSALIGRTEAAAALLEAADPLIEEALRPAADRLRGNLEMRTGNPVDAQAILDGAADRALEGGDPATAATLLLESAIGHTRTGNPTGMMDTLGRAEEAAAAAGGVAEVVTRIMLVVSRTVLGQSPDVHEQLAALEPLLAELPLVHLAEPVGLLGQIAMTVEEFTIAERIAEELLDQQRRAGAVGTLPYPLSVRAMLGERQGRWPEALADAREAVLVAHEVGHLTMHAFTLAVLAHIEADLGHTDSARAHARESAELADRGGATNLGIYSYAALGRAELAVEAAGAAAEALDEAARRRGLLAWREPAMVLDGADHVEALLRTGRQDEAAEALGRLAEQAETAGGTWGRAATERARLMMAEGDDVDAHAARALAWHEQAAMPYERARTELAWGERLRRMRLRSQARAPLTRALDTFRELGARPWVLRTERELEAAGARSPEPTSAGPGRDDLSTHELRIALMVAQGMTNREVAAALFLSPKTIEFHLSRIYRTLGVRSRTQLARFLARDQQAGIAP
ncbi:MAG TPA: AAA family ATPase [Thermoleophilaceae bacterium]|nr:AAA family ATPase [Thermoleophilaceae bacterium]